MKHYLSCLFITLVIFSTVSFFTATPALAAGIAYDDSQTATASGAASPLQWNHTVTGSNTVLLVGVQGNVSPSSVTFGGTNLTALLQTTDPSGNPIEIWGLIAPATGLHQVQVNWAGTKTVRAFSASYTGVRQTGLPDVSVSGGSAVAATSFTQAITIASNNSWTAAIALTGSGGTGITSGTNCTSRQVDATGINMWCDSNGALSPGSKNVTYNWSVNDTDHEIVIVSMAPPGASSFNFWQFANF